MPLEAVYLDTDGAYLAGGSYETVEAFTQHFNTVVLPRETAALGCVTNRLNVEHQERFERLIFPLSEDGEPAAKKYCGRFAIYQGKPVTGTVNELKGLEFKRGDATRLARRMQKEIIDLLMDRNEDPEIYEKLVLRWRDFIMTGDVPVEDIAKSKGVKELSEYKIRLRKDGSRILPGHVQIAEILRKRGENPFRVQYVVVDATTSPQTIVPLSDFDGTFDRFAVWKSTYPPSMRLLAGAFPNERNWKVHLGKRPKKVAKEQMSLL